MSIGALLNSFLFAAGASAAGPGDSAAAVFLMPGTEASAAGSAPDPEVGSFLDALAPALDAEMPLASAGGPAAAESSDRQALLAMLASLAEPAVNAARTSLPASHDLPEDPDPEKPDLASAASPASATLPAPAPIPPPADAAGANTIEPGTSAGLSGIAGAPVEPRATEPTAQHDEASLESLSGRVFHFEFRPVPAASSGLPFRNATLLAEEPPVRGQAPAGEPAPSTGKALPAQAEDAPAPVARPVVRYENLAVIAPAAAPPAGQPFTIAESAAVKPAGFVDPGFRSPAPGLAKRPSPIPGSSGDQVIEDPGDGNSVVPNPEPPPSLPSGQTGPAARVPILPWRPDALQQPGVPQPANADSAPASQAEPRPILRAPGGQAGPAKGEDAIRAALFAAPGRSEAEAAPFRPQTEVEPAIDVTLSARARGTGEKPATRAPAVTAGTAPASEPSRPVQTSTSAPAAPTFEGRPADDGAETGPPPTEPSQHGNSVRPAPGIPVAEAGREEAGADPQAGLRAERRSPAEAEPQRLAGTSEAKADRPSGEPNGRQGRERSRQEAEPEGRSADSAQRAIAPQKPAARAEAPPVRGESPTVRGGSPPVNVPAPPSPAADQAVARVKTAHNPVPADNAPGAPAAPPTAARPSEISVRVAGQPGRTPDVDVRVVDRAGDVHVVVRTPDPQAASALREQLPELVTRLERAGYETRFATVSEPGRPATQAAEAANPGDSAPWARSGAQQEQQQQQQQRRREDTPAEDWIEELRRLSGTGKDAGH